MLLSPLDSGEIQSQKSRLYELYSVEQRQLLIELGFLTPSLNFFLFVCFLLLVFVLFCSFSIRLYCIKDKSQAQIWRSSFIYLFIYLPDTVVSIVCIMEKRKFLFAGFIFLSTTF